MPYPPIVERHFWQPENAGPLAPGGGDIARGEAGSGAAGNWVVIEAVIDNGVIRRLGFRALACPWLIAGCSLATRALLGRPATGLADFDATVLAAELEAPVEKLGNLLILQDALRNCFRDWDTTQPAAAR